MKTFIVTLTALMFMVVVNAQEFSGKAIYKTHRKSSIKLDSTSLARNPGLQKQLEARMRKMFQKTYILEFTKTKSLYKQDVELDAPQPQAVKGGLVVMGIGGGSGKDVLYKNLKKQKVVDKSDLMGKIFLIKDDLVKYEWKLTNEQKNIGKYTCYKAVYEREVEEIKMDMVDGELKEKKTMVARKTVAWYTPEIAVSNGPGNYGGLPGLILEINDGNQTIVCTQIEMSNESISIEEPKGGKVVSRDKFEKISRKKSKEMMERFQSRRGNGKGMEIRIGG